MALQTSENYFRYTKLKTIKKAGATNLKETPFCTTYKALCSIARNIPVYLNVSSEETCGSKIEYWFTIKLFYASEERISQLLADSQPEMDALLLNSHNFILTRRKSAAII